MAVPYLGRLAELSVARFVVAVRAHAGRGRVRTCVATHAAVAGVVARAVAAEAVVVVVVVAVVAHVVVAAAVRHSIVVIPAAVAATVPTAVAPSVTAAVAVITWVARWTLGLANRSGHQGADDHRRQDGR